MLLITSSILMILCSSPINSVLFLIISFLSASSISFALGCNFIGIIFVLIYLGAISVLFLFIVMMIQIKNSDIDNTTYFLIGFMLLVAFFFQVYYTMIKLSNFSYLKTLFLNTDIYMFTNTNLLDTHSDEYFLTIGTILYVEYFFFLIILSMLLLLGMVGSIYLTSYKTGFSIRTQYNQVDRNNKLIIILFR